MAWSDGLVVGSPPHNIASSLNPRIRVIAGPGTGKSYAMKRRVARLLESGVPPARILPVTFTRVAAEDLHRELVGMNVPGCNLLKGVTLHGLAMRILMRNAVLAVTGRHVRPLNEFELEPLVADLMSQHGGVREVRKRKQAYEAAWARLQHETPGYAPTQQDLTFAADLTNWLIFHEAMLIGEVIPQLYNYLRLNPAAPERSEFSHILVDEFQDLNKVEQGVVDLLCQNAEVCIVGDDDQSIYSFKHAHPEGIRNWTVVNGNADDLGLDDCRRCPTHVVDMVNSLIAHNQSRTAPRALVPMAGNGPGDVRILQYPTLAHEVRGVANLVSGFLATGGTPGDILILAQRGVIGTPIYNALRVAGIPVRSYYAEAELDSLDAQRRFAVLKLFTNREDRVALRWLVGLGGANWNAAGYRRVRAHCQQTGLSPWQLLEQLSAGTLTLRYTASLVAAFQSLVAELAVLENAGSLSAVIDILFPANDPAVTEVRSIATAALADAGEDRQKLLSEISEAITQPEIPTVIEDVRIMSLHKSKGLSAPITIIAGCVEGLLPKQPEANTPRAEAIAIIEEQRRLFFVGMSRVKADLPNQKVGTLVLTYSQQMAMASAMAAGISPAGAAYGVARLHASRFLGELGPSAPAPAAG